MFSRQTSVKKWLRNADPTTRHTEGNATTGSESDCSKISFPPVDSRRPQLANPTLRTPRPRQNIDKFAVAFSVLSDRIHRTANGRFKTSRPSVPPPNTAKILAPQLTYLTPQRVLQSTRRSLIPDSINMNMLRSFSRGLSSVLRLLVRTRSADTHPEATTANLWQSGRQQAVCRQTICRLTAATMLLLPQSVSLADDKTSAGQTSVTTANNAQPADDQLSPTDLLMLKGESIWNKSCADCHGGKAEGVSGIYEDALAGDDTIGQLADVISSTMPEGEPELCVAEDAKAVAMWLHHNHYSEAARIRNRPPQVILTHLTANQLRQNLADLYAHFSGSMWQDNNQGVVGTYFDGSRWKKENLRFERVDPVINFDWKKDSPAKNIKATDFYVHWRGGLKVLESGRYEIIMRSTVAFKMDLGRFGRTFFDNHVQSGDKTEFRKSIYLLAGRVYPFDINLYQRKRKTEQPPVRACLSWVPPHGAEEVIPNRNLIATSPPATFALQSKLPPDDRSYGYDRGLAVDRQWDESTTAAAIEFGTVAAEELWPDYQRKHKKDGNEDRARLRNFIQEVAQVAFRGLLSDQEKQFYIHEQINQTADDSEAIKRCLLTILKSPRFLYPALDANQSPSQKAANRIALTLFDSLPADQQLLKRIEKGQLEKEQHIRQVAQQFVRDYRCQGKLKEMLFEWMNLSHLTDITKNSEAHPNFDQKLVADLKASLSAFLDDMALNSDSDFRKLFSADWSYSNARLAQFYGKDWQPPAASSLDSSKAKQSDSSDDDSKDAAKKEAKEGLDYIGLLPVDSLRKTPSKPGSPQGLLAHPYLMSGLAYTDSTSPIHRGVFLIRFMLGRTLRPPNAAFSPLSPDLHPDLTTRQRVELQTSPDSCQVCHIKINGLGFALENFDEVGRLRKKDGGKDVDSSGSYTDRSGQRVTFKGSEDLARYLATSDDAHAAFVNRAFQHFVKQPIAAFGPEKLEQLTQKFRSSNYNIQQLIVEIAVIAATPPASSQPASNENS